MNTTRPLSATSGALSAVNVSISGDQRGLNIGRHKGPIHYDGSQFQNQQAEQKKTLLRNFSYPGMFNRFGMLEDAPPAQQTFAWLLEEQEEAEQLLEYYALQRTRLKHSLSGWLSASTSDESIYWIAGKPGSGKSSLMYFLVMHRKTRAYLLQWCGDRSLIISHFFFWRASGDPYQKNRKGLYRSLLYQVCDQVEHAIGVASPELLYSDPSVEQWSSKRYLREIIHILNSTPEMYFAFFIDGLDEFEGTGPRGRISDLLADIREIAACPNVKMCASSRIEGALHHELAEEPGIRLHELNRSGIGIYAKEKLCKYPAIDISAYDIAERADGVFLWAVIIVQRVIDQFLDGVSISVIHRFLDQMPQELEDLFKEIHSRISEHQKRELTFYINSLLLATQTSAGLSIALLGILKAPHIRHNYRAIALECAQIERQLIGLSRGLLSILHFSPHYHSYYEGKTYAVEQDDSLMSVETIRSAQDLAQNRRYLEENDDHARFRHYNATAIEWAHRSVFDFYRSQTRLLKLDRQVDCSSFNTMTKLNEAMIVCDIMCPSDRPLEIPCFRPAIDYAWALYSLGLDDMSFNCLEQIKSVAIRVPDAPSSRRIYHCGDAEGYIYFFTLWCRFGEAHGKLLLFYAEGTWLRFRDHHCALMLYNLLALESCLDWLDEGYQPECFSLRRSVPFAKPSYLKVEQHSPYHEVVMWFSSSPKDSVLESVNAASICEFFKHRIGPRDRSMMEDLLQTSEHMKEDLLSFDIWLGPLRQDVQHHTFRTVRLHFLQPTILFWRKKQRPYRVWFQQLTQSDVGPTTKAMVYILTEEVSDFADHVFDLEASSGEYIRGRTRCLLSLMNQLIELVKTDPNLDACAQLYMEDCIRCDLPKIWLVESKCLAKCPLEEAECHYLSDTRDSGDEKLACESLDEVLEHSSDRGDVDYGSNHQGTEDEWADARSTQDPGNESIAENSTD